MRRTFLRMTRSVKFRLAPGDLRCSACGGLLALQDRDGRLHVEPCLECQPAARSRIHDLRGPEPLQRLIRRLAFQLFHLSILAVALVVSLPAHGAYEMTVTGSQGKLTWWEGVVGESLTFAVSGTGDPIPGAPPCNTSEMTYSFEDNVVHSAGSGSTVTLTSQPGLLRVGWRRFHRDEFGVEGSCDGGGSASASFYAWVRPTLDEVTITPDDIKINVPFLLWITHIPCEPGSDPCRAGPSYNLGDGSCPEGSFCTDPLIYDTLGVHTLRVRAANLAGRSENEKQFAMDVRATQAPSAFFFSPSSPVAGTPVTFAHQTSNGYRSLFWDFGDGTFSTEENPVHTFAASDDYEVRLTATNEIGSDTYSSTFFVQPASGGSAPGGASFTFSPAKPVTGQTVQFTDASTGTIDRWRWKFGDGSEASYERNPSHVYSAQAVYNAELWVSNRFGRKGLVLFVPVANSNKPPLADFEFTPFDVRVGVPVQFTDTSAGASTWLWDFGEDGATSTQQNPTYTYRTPGQKAVSLTVTNAFGQDSRTKFFACHGDDGDQLESKFVFSPAQPETGEPVRFTDLSTGSPDRWSWVISDGTQSNQRNFTHTFTAPGQYGVSLRVDKGSQQHISVQVVNVGNATGPNPEFTWSPGTPAPNQLVTFTNLSSDATSYTWEFGDGSTSDAVDPKHTFTAAGTYSVKLTAGNGNQTRSITKQLTVSSVPIPPAANFIANPNPASVNTSVRFTDTSTGAPTQWSWDFGYSNQKSTVRNPTHSFPFEGTFLVKLVASNSAGSSSVTLPVVIRNQILKPDPDFDWSPDPALAMQPVLFRDKSANAPKGWSWTFGDGTTGSGSAPVHTYAKPGNYTVTLRVSNEAGESELSRIVAVGAPPLQADFVIEPAKPAAGKPVKLSDRSTGNPVAWKWIVDGSVVGTSQNLNWTFFTGGEHTVGLEVRGSAGNDSFRQKGIEVLAPPVASFKAGGALVFGGSVTFSDTSSGNPTIRRWYFDDVFAGNGQTTTRSFTKTGSVTVRLEVENEAGKDGLTRFYYVAPNRSSAPEIKRVQPQFGPCFYSAHPITTPVEVDVDWRAHQAKFVTLELNAVADPPAVGSVPTTVLNLESRRLAFGSTVNNLEFTAIGDGGSPSAPTVVKLLGISMPDYLVGRVARTITESRRKSWTAGVYLPAEAWESKELKLPKFLGGGAFQITKTQFKLEKILRTDCSMATYAEIVGGIKLGKAFGGIKGAAVKEKKLSELDKNNSDELTVSLEGFIGSEVKLRVDDVIPAMKAVCENAIIEEYICKVAEVKVEGQGSLGGSAIFNVGTDGSVAFKNTEKYFEVQVTASGALSVGSAKFEAFGGGKGNFKLGDFSDPNLVKQADLTAEFGGRLTWFGSVYERKTGWGCTFAYDKEAVCGQNVANLTFGQELPGRLEPVALIDRTSAVEVAGKDFPILLENVSSLADPSSVSRGDETVVVFLSEQAGHTNPLQRLDVKALRGNGNEWTGPESIAIDANGDFNPTVTLDANERTVVAWERVRDSALSHADIPTLEDMPKLLREMEIAVSMSGAGSTVWTQPELLTDNQVQDRQPALAPLADGRTLLVWIRESGGGEQQILARTLSGAAWSAEQVVGTALRGASELALAAHETEAVLIVAHRRGAESNRDLSFYTFRNGWSAVESLTEGGGDHHSPLVAWNGGAAHVSWMRDGALVTRALSGGTIEVARAADGVAVTNAIAAVRADGVPIIVWSSGTDIRAILRDPNGNQWTPDFVLSDRSRSHSSLSAQFTGGGALRISSLGTIIERHDVPAVVDGKPVMIEDVARPGRSDLIEITTTLDADLAALGATFAAEPRQPLDGEGVVLSVDVENRGHVPVRDVVVDLVREGTLAGTTLVPGPWMPGETKRVGVPITHLAASPDLLVVVDPSGATNDVVPANNQAAFSFANQPPVACFQTDRGSGALPLTIALDAGCSLDPDGALAAWSWSFGDGGGATGANATHTFTTAGAHTIILTVADSMGAKSSRTITIDAGLPEDRRQSESLHRLYFAAVGRVAGLNDTFFVSDVSLINTDVGAPLTVEAVYMPKGRDDSYRRNLTLAPGAMLQAGDVVTQLFGATDGSGALRFDLSHAHAVAIARTYNEQPSGTAGQSSEGLPPEAALRDGERGVILQHWLPGFRTNLGLTEIDGIAAQVIVHSFDEVGTAMGQESFTVAPFQHVQIDGHPLLQSRGRIEVTIEGGGVIVYASTVDNGTGDPIFQLAERVPAGNRSLLLPVVGRLAGEKGTSWRSNVRISNAGASTQQVTLSLRTPGGVHDVTQPIAAGETFAWDDVITSVYPQLTGDVGGSLLITADGPLIATSRTFNLAPEGTYGLYVPARASQELTGAGESAWLAQLRETGAYRCNLGITSERDPVVVSVRAFDTSGTTLAVKQYAVSAGQHRQVSRLFADMGVPLPLEAAGAEVTVLEGTALIYASVIDNRTGDTTYIEAK